MIITHYQYSAENMLESKSFEEGALYYIEDTQNVYLDPVGGSERIKIANDIKILAAESDREELLSPVPGKMYFVLETSKYYIYYNETWYAGGGSNKPRAGLIYINPSNSLPDGFLWCDGSSYLKTDYPELYAAIGNTYYSNSAEGELLDGADGDYFVVPNLSTRVPIGAGTGYELGQQGGDEEDTVILVNQSDSTNSTDANTNLYTVVNYIISTGKDSETLSVSDIIASMQVLPLAIEYGGTGADNASTALSNLGGASTTYVNNTIASTKTTMTEYTDNSVSNAKTTLTAYVDQKVANIDTGATEEYVDNAIAGIDTGATEEYVDNATTALNDSLKEYVTEQISNIDTGVSEEYVSSAIKDATENMVVDVPTLEEHLSEEKMILSSLQYGTSLPETGTEGQVFFLIVT